MSVDEHPEYPEENDRLRRTYDFLRGLVDGYPHEFQGGDARAAQAIRRTLLKQLGDYKEALQEPYFGRLDWHDHGLEAPETFYIGRVHFDDSRGAVAVYSWASDLVGGLYYGAPEAESRGRLLLKRTFRIKRDVIEDIRDEFVDPSQEHRLGSLIERFTDRMLAVLLKESRTGQLRSIVSTIQAQQYEIIRSPEDQILIVQGVTGSGKTEIALHRVAYLLYQRRDDRRAQDSSVLIMGPNRLFLNYISAVLPFLGERQVPQVTFDEWLTERMGVKVEFQPAESSLEYLFDPGVPRLARASHFRRAQLKGSLRMSRLLDLYVDRLYHDLQVGRQDLQCVFDSKPGVGDSSPGPLSVTCKVEIIHRAFGRHRELPLNSRKAAVRTSLVDGITQEFRNQPETRRRGRDLSTEDLRKKAELQVDQYLADWHAQNVSVCYRKLLRTPRLLHELGKGLFASHELELLAQDAPTAQEPFQFSDLGALAYLKLLLDGPQGGRYDHIVLDEAQDITPLQFHVICRYSRSGSITALGDLAQKIYPHHGIESWGDLRSASCDYPIKQQSLRQSYRSTAQIIDFANAMLRRLGVTKDQLAEPISREGATPMLHACADRQEWLAMLRQLVRLELENEHKSVAIVSKTASSCQLLAEQLAEVPRLSFSLILDRNSRYEGGVVILPAYLTKGLEFDVVIVADADRSTYTPDWLDARLLYVVLTRAAHMLHICHVSEITPLLDPGVEQIAPIVPFAEISLDRTVTLQEYGTLHPEFDPDGGVQLLARMDKLYLLEEGRIDQAILELLLLNGRGATVEAEGEEEAPSLDEAVEEELRRRCAEAEAGPPRIAAALAVTQLAAGLLRHPMVSLGIEIQEDANEVSSQVIVLARAYHALANRGLILGAGRWTTMRRTLQAVSSVRADAAQRLLALLIDYGIVERIERSRQFLIRVVPGRVMGVLLIGLGAQPDDWDPDLLSQLEPRPPAFYSAM